MNCIVTAGPTAERMDHVRRLTNNSTGRLGCELAAFLAGQKHQVTLLLGTQATWRGIRQAATEEEFTDTAELQALLEKRAGDAVDAVFHAAAVSDFNIGRVWRREDAGRLTEVRAGKYSTRDGVLLAELSPTPKIIKRLRGWFPQARIVGWKYEVDGNRETAIAAGQAQMIENQTNACVVNGPAYGEGFCLLRREGEKESLADRTALYARLARFINE